MHPKKNLNVGNIQKQHRLCDSCQKHLSYKVFDTIGKSNTTVSKTDQMDTLRKFPLLKPANKNSFQPADRKKLILKPRPHVCTWIGHIKATRLVSVPLMCQKKLCPLSTLSGNLCDISSGFRRVEGGASVLQHSITAGLFSQNEPFITLLSKSR